MITMKKVNDVIKSETSQYIDLHKGEGYFYFVYDDGKRYSTASVYVNSLNQLALTSWIYEAKVFHNMLKTFDQLKA